MSVVLLCPGQSLVPRDLGELVRAAGDDLAAAYADRLGPEAFDDPTASFARQQAALVALGVARARRVLALLQEPEHAATYGEVVAVAGHSLGEVTALFVAGAIDGPAAVQLAADRGQAMQDARTDDWGDASMLAISGPTVHEQIEPLIVRHGVELANDNAGDQVVAVGLTERLVALAHDARDGGLRAVRLETTGPSHSTFMRAAVEPLTAAVEQAITGRPTMPVWSALTAAQAVDLPREMGTSVASPVRWRETLLDLAGLHPTHFLDIGPGGAMARLARKTVPDVPAHTLDELDPR